VLLVGPAFFLQLAARLLRLIGLKRAGNWLATRRLFLETRLSRRMAELVFDELLDLDKVAPDKDRLPPWARRVEDLIAEYVAARHAVAELAAGVAALVIGLVLLQALTPSALSLGPILAQEYAQSSAIQDFWAGSWAGGYYYSWYPAEASLGEKAATTVLVMVIFAVGSTFIGIVTDPLQQLWACTAAAWSASSTPCGGRPPAARTPAWACPTPTSPGWPTWSTGSRWATG
jgi:hypothetical protein